MALTRAQKIALVMEALQDHLPWTGEDADRRTLAQLRRAFEERHLGALVKSYRRTKAAKDLEDFDIADMG